MPEISETLVVHSLWIHLLTDLDQSLEVDVLADHGHAFPQLLLLLLQWRGGRRLGHISTIGICGRGLRGLAIFRLAIGHFSVLQLLGSDGLRGHSLHREIRSQGGGENQHLGH